MGVYLDGFQIMGSYKYIMPVSFGIESLQYSHKGRKLVSITEPSHDDSDIKGLRVLLSRPYLRAILLKKSFFHVLGAFLGVYLHEWS